MSFLTIYNEDNNKTYKEFTNIDDIKKELKNFNIHFDRWNQNEIHSTIQKNSTENDVLKVYHHQIEELKQMKLFTTVDVISINKDIPNKEEVRNKFLNEHTHTEDEARFFIGGKGLFYIHKNNKVLSILCEQNDLIYIPAGTQHWFDMGEYPYLKCIRFFTNPEGWVANFTHSNISKKFPLLST